MTSHPHVAGVRLAPRDPVLWVECDEPALPPGGLCLLDTPRGRRSARVVVAPQLVLQPGPVLAGYRVAGALTDEGALAVEPAASLLRAATDAVRPGDGTVVRVAPDGAQVTLLAERPGELAGVAAQLLDRLRVPVLVRGPAGELESPELPDLLEEVPYGGAYATVEGISVYNGHVTLRTPDGGTVQLPLAAYRDAGDATLPRGG